MSTIFNMFCDVYILLHKNPTFKSIQQYGRIKNMLFMFRAQLLL